MAVAAVRTLPEIAEYARDARLTRLVALAVDTVAYSIIWSIANNVYGVIQVTSVSMPVYGSGVPYFSAQTTIPFLAASAIYVLYFIIPEAMFGATPGKAMFRLRVVSVDGQPLGFGSIVSRNLLRIVDALPVLYLVGGTAIMFSLRSQRIGDMVAGTTVVYRHRVPAPAATRTSTPTERLFLALGVTALIVSSVAFDYFGRPPLVLQGDFNTRNLMGLDSYTLGKPAWSAGSVTYPITGRRASATCAGSIELEWSGWLEGWQLMNGLLSCPPDLPPGSPS